MAFMEWLPASSFQLPAQAKPFVASSPLDAGSRKLEAFSYFFRERIAKTVEDEIPEQEERDGRGADGQQPLPVADRSLEVEDLLIRDREVRHRVQVQDPQLPVLHLVVRVDDRRREEPERHQVAE